MKASFLFNILGTIADNFDFEFTEASLRRKNKRSFELAETP